MLAQSFGKHAMLKNAIAALILVAALPAVAAEQIKVAGDGTISLGEWGKVLNSILLACKSPSDPALMIQTPTPAEIPMVSVCSIACFLLFALGVAVPTGGRHSAANHAGCRPAKRVG